MPITRNNPAILDVDVPITVHFDATTTLAGTFKGFRANFQYLVLEEGGNRHYIKDYWYFTETITP